MGARHSAERSDRKRARREISVHSCEAGTLDVEEDSEVTSPSKRRNIRSTSVYIYKTLFEDGINSDVTITALNKEWKLHKLYLSQSLYFRSMFSGDWKEKDEPVIRLDIPDENIDTEALDLALGSLYKDEVELTAHRICPTVAAASLLQLDGLKEHCIQFMKDNLNVSSVLYFLKTSSIYEIGVVKERCMEWLHLNVVWDSSAELLGEMDQDLLLELIKSPDLFVMQVEMDVYTMAKKWLFLQMCPNWSGENSKLLHACDNFFQELGEKNGMEFLVAEEGGQYGPVFRSIRYRSIVNDAASIQSIEEDKIVPSEWLLPLYKQQWMKMLDVEQGIDPGPVTVSSDVFSKMCTRCGRVLTEDILYCWRWTGFSFGFDLLITYSSGEIFIKRNTYSQTCNASVSLQARRVIVFRMKVVSCVDGDAMKEEDTGIVRIALAPDEEQSVLKLNKPVVFPLYIGMNYCITGNQD